MADSEAQATRLPDQDALLPLDILPDDADNNTEDQSEEDSDIYEPNADDYSIGDDASQSTLKEAHNNNKILFYMYYIRVRSTYTLRNVE